MPFYVKQGDLPAKHHVTFYKDARHPGVQAGQEEELYREELVSTHGFASLYSTKYHHNMPTKSPAVERLHIEHGALWQDSLVQNYKLNSRKADRQGNFYNARNRLFFNQDLSIHTARVTESTDQFYRNAYADEIIFVHEGEGELLSEYGRLEVRQWDYLVIPRGTIYQLHFNNYDNVRLFIVEANSMVEIPKHYRNEYGQLLETAPYCERDIRAPQLTDPIVEQGNFQVISKYRDQYQAHQLQWHPFDLVGWDGYLYPWAFNIQDFQPIVGKIHLPPSIHQVFGGRGFVLCNFVPRLYDFHPEAIPAPYYHSNVDSDEVLYYVDGDFMSRTGIDAGYITLHQGGVPHGPQPGKTEASIGAKETQEYAVMVDTFAPLQLTEHVKNTMAGDYHQSWLESEQPK
jgi:homogentisate 1,2-dioxygenase